MAHGLVGLIFLVFILGLIFLCVFLFMGIKALAGGVNKNLHREEEDTETRMIQEMYQGLSRLEDRVESLETLLLDKDRGNYETRKK